MTLDTHSLVQLIEEAMFAHKTKVLGLRVILRHKIGTLGKMAAF